MQSFDARLASFNPIQKPKSRSKPGFPLTPSTHPRLTPQLLSEAGFYHIPTSSSSTYDTCKCFLCGLQLGGWEENDDPFEEHDKRGGCAWAEIVCALKVDGDRHGSKGGKYRMEYPSAESLPSSVDSANVRKQTFRDWWPHKASSSWKPSVQSLAEAGFIYTPTADADDNVTCPLCNYSVEGWEADDEPMEIHEKKSPTCAFFIAKVAPGKQGSGSKTGEPSKPAAAKAKTSTRPKRGTIAPAMIESEGDIIVFDSDPESKPKRKPRATTTSKSSTARKAKTKSGDPTETEEEVVVEETMEEVVPAREDPDEEQFGEPETKAKKGKAKGKAKAKPKKAGKKKKDAEPEEEAEADEPEDVQEEEAVHPDPQPEPPAKSAKPSKSSRSKPSATNDMLPPPEPTTETSYLNIFDSPSKPSSQASKPSKPSKSKTKSKIASSADTSSFPAPLSQLEQFANIPLSPQSLPVPSREMTSQKPKTSHSAPARIRSPIPAQTLPRETLDKSVRQGAEAARRVVDELIESSALLSPPPRGGDTVQKIAGSPGVEEVVLSEKVLDMSLEELIREEMKKRYDELQREGEEMISTWERRTKEARKRIESL